MNMKQHDIVRKAPEKKGTMTPSVVVHVAPFFTKDLAYTMVLALVAFGVISLSSWFVATDPFKKDIETQKITEALISRSILSYEVLGKGKDAEVAYSYKGGRVPDLLSASEVKELRTETSFTSSEGKDATGKGIYTVVAYPKPSFRKESDGWYYIEYDRAPKELFDTVEKGKVAFIEHIIPVARAATVYAAAGDGIVNNYAGDWASTHDATTGLSVDSATEFVTVSSNTVSGKIAGSTISRIFLPFDTSSIPAGATITSATLGAYATNTPPTYPGDAYDYISVVRTSQATHTTLVLNDYDNVASTEGIATGDRKEVSTITIGNYITFPLNATGITWIAKAGVASNCSATAGITCLGIRDGHDIQNTSPGVDAVTTYAIFSSSEVTGTSQDPYLAITYTAPFAFWQFDIF